MILFAYRAVTLGPRLGTAAIALIAVIGMLPVGTLLVYLGNRRNLPIVTFVLALGRVLHLRRGQSLRAARR